MAQVSVSIKIDPELKRDFTKLCAELDMSISTAINEFAKSAVRKQKMPFKVSGYDRYGYITKAELERRMEDVKAGRNLVEFDLSNI